MAIQIILDTETTGLDPSQGDKIVEIGCVEVNNLIPTGRTFHKYINPERLVSEKSFSIHGLSDEFLATFGVFHDIYDDFMVFIGNHDIVAHNAMFDMKFLQHEVAHISKAALTNRVVDTLQLARNKLPGKGFSLDALCRHYNIDNTKRTKHGALVDAELLTEVYLHLEGGRQPELFSEMLKQVVNNSNENTAVQNRQFNISPEEQLKHREMIKKMTNSLWSKGRR
jgi:DNA polymerase-3 subunit epsilon